MLITITAKEIIVSISHVMHGLVVRMWDCQKAVTSVRLSLKVSRFTLTAIDVNKNVDPKKRIFLTN